MIPIQSIQERPRWNTIENRNHENPVLVENHNRSHPRSLADSSHLHRWQHASGHLGEDQLNPPSAKPFHI